jgi:hypothetical protein
MQTSPASCGMAVGLSLGIGTEVPVLGSARLPRTGTQPCPANRIAAPT